MAVLDYSGLYKIQDQVLSVIFDTEREFYLTGGTCLSVFIRKSVILIIWIFVQ